MSGPAQKLPSGVAKFHAHYLDLSVYTATFARRFNDHGCIVLALGDAGDRLFGTEWRWLLRQGCAMASTWMRRSTFMLKP
jgi:Uracil phosphoribosyltransferase